MLHACMHAHTQIFWQSSSQSFSDYSLLGLLASLSLLAKLQPSLATELKPSKSASQLRLRVGRTDKSNSLVKVQPKIYGPSPKLLTKSNTFAQCHNPQRRAWLCQHNAHGCWKRFSGFTNKMQFTGLNSRGHDVEQLNTEGCDVYTLSFLSSVPQCRRVR